MRLQISSVPRILLPDQWGRGSTSPSSSSSDRSVSSQNSCCKACCWTGNPGDLFIPDVLIEGPDGDPDKIFTFGELSRSDCIRCQILTSIIRGTCLRFTDNHPSQNAMILIKPEGVMDIFGGNKSFEVEMALFISPNAPEIEPLLSIPELGPKYIDTSTEASLPWAQEQIKVHEGCCESENSGSFVPTRLINVSTGGGAVRTFF
ncbi:hypothetical protein F4806DRAFT_208178 [Annulohypoxylon nitens]|nr:hypothetical protein F4806DRAFT_208178 [Annulohypoxylon nitens]